MRVVVCLSGLDTREFVERSLERLPGAADLYLLYVIDSRPSEELNFVRRTHLSGARAGSGRTLQMQEADRELAQEMLSQARQLFEEQPNKNLRVAGLVVLEGRPEWQIVNYLDQHQADLIVIGTRYRGDLRPAPPPPPKDKPAPPIADKPNRGPHSIGPVARFVIDHALCDLLIIK